MSPEEKDAELLTYMGTNSKRWAEEFCKIYPAVPYDDAFSWFSNAINAGRREEILKIEWPDEAK